MAKYDPPSYRNYLRISIESGRNKHILVEGKDDKYLIERLWQDFLGRSGTSPPFEVLVDSAENLIKGDEKNSFFNNREKVELIARSVNSRPYADGFVGFVDRELRKFDWDCELISELRDCLESHEIVERLVFSRGHSLENYIFDFSLLSEVLEGLSTTAYANKALALFKETFEPTLRIACTIGLAAAKAEVLSKMKETINYKLIEINSLKEIEFKLEDWLQKLEQRGISEEKRQAMRLYYPIYQEQVSKASISLARWLCHGHIGYDFLRALYERCVVKSGVGSPNESQELSGISWVKKDRLFYVFMNCWVKKSLENQCEYPREVFELLGILE